MVARAREFQKEDIEAIDKIFQKQPDLGIPSLKNVIKNCTFVVTAGSKNIKMAEEKIVGYGVLHNNGFISNFPEATLIIDKKLRSIDKGRAVRDGINMGIKACKEAGLETLFIIVDDEKYPNYTKILENHFDAVKVPGTLLMIEVE